MTADEFLVWAEDRPGRYDLVDGDPKRQTAVHHRRGNAEMVETRIVSTDVLELAPPSLRLRVSDLFAEAREIESATLT